MNQIHSTALIDSDVVMGVGNTILPYTILSGPLVIGDGNIIGPHVTIGEPGADTRERYYDSSKARIEIGDRNIIREFSAIQKPAYEKLTKIGNDCFLMQGANVSHDVVIEDKVVVTANCSIAGLVKLLEGANLGMGCTVNQYSIIGQYSIVATGAAAMKCVKPFSRYIPSRPPSVNVYAVKKFGYEKYMTEISAYVLNDQRPKDGVVAEIVERFEIFVKIYGREVYR